MCESFSKLERISVVEESNRVLSGWWGEYSVSVTGKYSSG